MSAVVYYQPARRGAPFFTDADGILATYKDNDSVITYGVDWSRYLNGDTIATSTWESSGLNLTAPTNTTTTTGITVGLTGSRAKNTITTTGGQTFIQTIRFYQVST